MQFKPVSGIDHAGLDNRGISQFASLHVAVCAVCKFPSGSFVIKTLTSTLAYKWQLKVAKLTIINDELSFVISETV